MFTEFSQVHNMFKISFLLFKFSLNSGFTIASANGAGECQNGQFSKALNREVNLEAKEYADHEKETTVFEQSVHYK